MLQRLDLTDAQKEQVRAIFAERSGQNAAQTLGKLQRDLAAAVMADTPDTAKIEQLKASINDAEAAALNERVDLQLRIAQILTPEQRQKARDLPAAPRGRGAF
jgi:Spy/CpxP family protein refolding chaperone